MSGYDYKNSIALKKNLMQEYLPGNHIEEYKDVE